MRISDFALVVDLVDDETEKAIQGKITRTSKMLAQFTLGWQSDCATHIDSQLVDNISVWRDFFPPEIEAQLDGRSAGDRLSPGASGRTGETRGRCADRAQRPADEPERLASHALPLPAFRATEYNNR